MAKQTGFNKRAKFKIWIYKHRVLTGFISLVAALVLYLVCSWLVLQVQIHFERARFEAESKDILKLKEQIDIGNNFKYQTYCYYESSTVEFTKGNQYCVIRLTGNQSYITQENAKDNSLKYVSILKKLFKTDLHLNANDKYTLDNYSFDDKKISCNYDAKYYDSNVNTYDRVQIADDNGSEMTTDIICSSSAKTSYFRLQN